MPPKVFLVAYDRAGIVQHCEPATMYIWEHTLADWTARQYRVRLTKREYAPGQHISALGMQQLALFQTDNPSAPLPLLQEDAPHGA
jgi:hypothetical protein